MESIIQIHINKTGGTSLRQALGLGKHPRHMRASEARAKYPEYDEALTFSFVRNPFDRVVSLYEYQWMMNYNRVCSTAITFDAWVREVFEKRGGPYFHNARYYQPCAWWLDVDVDLVYKFEEWDEAVADIEEQTGRVLTVPHLKRTDRRPYQEYYTPEVRAIVEGFFEEDLRRFGYEF